MQDPKSKEKIDISNALSSKSVSVSSNSQFGSPVQLIAFNEEKGFYITEEAVSFFESLKSNKIGIITIVGKNRTGKSYLMNRVVLNKNSGFQVGHTINPCTKGIWIWPEVIQIENNKNEDEKLSVLVMDSEGIGATDQVDNYDTKIFMLAMLLSSYFIYNSVGTIDEKAITNLSLIVNLSKHLQKANEKEFEDLLESFPSFLWVLRDFALKLVDPSGNPISTKEYLENALKQQKGLSEGVESKNRIRRLLTNFFKDRDCYMMVRPTESEKDMQHLNELPQEKLRSEFIDQVTNLRKKIYTRVKPKIFKKKPLTGSSFLALARLLCGAVNSGDSLNIDNSWSAICKIECEKLISELGDYYERELKNELDKKMYADKELKNLFKSKREETFVQFRKRAIGDDIKEFEEKLYTLLSEKTLQIKYHYLNQIKSKLNNILDQKVENIETKVNKKEFSKFTDFVDEYMALKSSLEEENTDSFSKAVIFDNLLQKFIKLTEIFVYENNSALASNDLVSQEKLKTMESLMSNLRNDFENKTIDYINKFKELESEKSRYKAELNLFEEKARNAKEEKESQKQLYDAKINELTRLYQEKEKDFKQQISQLKEENKALEREKNEVVAENSKKIAIQSQQLQFNEMQMQTLNNTISDLKSELQNERTSHRSSIRALEDIKKMIEYSPAQNTPKQTQEEESELINEKFAEVIKENEDLRKQVIDLKRKMKSDIEEFYEQKLCSERELKDMERRFKEKHADDEFTINALKKRLKSFEDADFALLETNKNLSIALERADTRCYNIEKKVDQLRKYQKIVKNACDISCKFCKKLIKKNLFHAHLEICSMNEDRSYEFAYNNASPSFSVSFEERLSTRTTQNDSKANKNWSNNKSPGDAQTFSELIKNQMKETDVPKCLTEMFKITNESSPDKSENRNSNSQNNTEISTSLNRNIRDSEIFQDFMDITKGSNTLIYSLDEKQGENESGVLYEESVISPSKSRNKENNRYIDENQKSFKVSKSDESYTKISFEKHDRKRKLLIDTDTFDGEERECKENLSINSGVH